MVLHSKRLVIVVCDTVHGLDVFTHAQMADIILRYQ